MSEDYGDWVDRFLKRCREIREGFVGEILSGRVTLDRYHELCARADQLDWVTGQLPEFQRGEDLRRPQRGPMRSIEE